MAVVKRFNVNEQQVTLDPDIIENMSANDVSYDSSSQYDENTVGDKLSELKYYVTVLMKSISHTQKSFVVETNDTEGYIYIDGVKNTIPANSIKVLHFNDKFGSGNDNNPGIASFHFLVTITSEIKNMSYMFYNCSSLTSLDLSNFDTSAVINMSIMFKNCSSLTSLDVSNFDTSSVINMEHVFYNCLSLTSLDVSNFDTSAVINMSSMFYNCSSLTSLDLSNFDTSRVTNINGMFVNCSSLTSLDVSNFDTSKVTNMGSMFYGCSALTSLDVSNFDTSRVTSMAYMFGSCSSLTSLDLSNFNTSAVTNMERMFRSLSLTSLNLSDFDTSAVTTMEHMFTGCTSLTNLLLGPNFFKTSEVSNIDFSTCSNWTNKDTVITSLVANSYDRVAAGLNTLTLQLHENTKRVLSDEQKATITAKGYTIA